jgi:hypothetical protein
VTESAEGPIETMNQSEDGSMLEEVLMRLLGTRSEEVACWEDVVTSSCDWLDGARDVSNSRAWA